jgi:hypothetical protein
MRDFLYLISGEVPGGILLLLFLFVVINLALRYLYKSSKLFSRQEYKRKAIRANVFLFGLYIILWFVLEPPALPDRVLILPFQQADKADYILTESLQRQIKPNLQKRYTCHPWEWFYETANYDSLPLEIYRLQLAAKLQARVILSGSIAEKAGGLEVRFRLTHNSGVQEATITGNSCQPLTLQIINWLGQHSALLKKERVTTTLLSDDQIKTITEAKILLLDDQYKQVLKILSQPDSDQTALLAAAYLHQGITELEKQPALLASEQPRMNLPFRHLYNLLLPYSKEGRDTATMNVILARMYLYLKNYEMADICLARAATQEPFNARVYFYLSFLHESRYHEMGFKTRTAVLKHAVDLDPGYAQAVCEFAQEIYNRGNAAATNLHTIKAIAALRHFLTLNPQNQQVLALLGRLLLQSKYTPEAARIYQRLIHLSDNSAEHHYNLGICYFHLKDYEQATKQFERAIAIDDFPDAYLYLGAINRLAGNIDKALYYYRERVKREKGADDVYAKEAMRGIRLILNEMAEKEEQEKINENTPAKNR